MFYFSRVVKVVTKFQKTKQMHMLDEVSQGLLVIFVNTLNMHASQSHKS